VVRVGNTDKAKKNGEASTRVAFKPERVRDNAKRYTLGEGQIYVMRWMDWMKSTKL
jgi:hypothetical protein